MMKLLLLTAFALSISVNSRASEPDFIIGFQECKTVLGTLSGEKSEVKVMETSVKPTMACTRASTKLNCKLAFPDNSPTKDMQYQIELDAPPILMFKMENGAELVVVNTTQHSAVMETRIVLDTVALGAKVCSGLFATTSEMKLLKDASSKSEKKKK